MHILRLRGDQDFDVVVIPYRQGQRPADLDVSLTAAGDIQVIRSGQCSELTDTCERPCSGTCAP